MILDESRKLIKNCFKDLHNNPVMNNKLCYTLWYDEKIKKQRHKALCHVNWFNNKNYLKDVLFYFMKHDFMSPRPASNSLYRWGWPGRILLSPHSKRLDYRCMPLHLAQSWVFYVRYSTIPDKLETVNTASRLTQHALLSEPSSTVPMTEHLSTLLPTLTPSNIWNKTRANSYFKER